MWTPFDIFFIAWFCNFAPCDNARLIVKETIQHQENKEQL